MQQRRLRLGDILDDYCPRERRVTNHAIVAMIEDEVRQTRCTTCDAEHEYKEAKVPASRRRKPHDAPEAPPSRPRPAAASDLPLTDDEVVGLPDDDHEMPDSPALAAATDEEPHGDDDVVSDEDDRAGTEDEGPVHRRLIRATLPRPEGQVPERRPAEFTVRQQGGREVDGNRANGQRPRGHQRHGRPAQPHGGGAAARFGGQRHGAGQGQGHGQPQGQRGNRFGGTGGGRGQRPGGQGGGGRKRGR